MTDKSWNRADQYPGKDLLLLRLLLPDAASSLELDTRKNNIDHVGQSNDIQTFFEAPGFNLDDPKWVEYAPPSLPLAKKNKHARRGAPNLQAARHQREEDGFYAEQIRLQSPYLRDCLRDTLEPFGIKYKDNVFAESAAPHRGLFFALDRIAELAKTAEDEITRTHCELLCRVTEEYFDDTLDQLEELEKEQKITYDLLWTLFPEGRLVRQAERFLARRRR